MKREKGQGLAEYALVLVVVGVILYIALIPLMAAVGPSVEDFVGSVRDLANLASQSIKPIPQGAPTVIPDNSHAEKHEFEDGKSQEISIQDMRDCMNNGGVWETWQNPKTKHWMDVCKFGEDTWGLRCVNNCNEELTGWIAEGPYQVEVEEYLIRNGYQVFP